MPCLVCENVIQYIVLDTMHRFYVTLFKKNMVVKNGVKVKDVRKMDKKR